MSPSLGSALFMNRRNSEELKNKTKHQWSGLSLPFSKLLIISSLIFPMSRAGSSFSSVQWQWGLGRACLFDWAMSSVTWDLWSFKGSPGLPLKLGCTVHLRFSLEPGMRNGYGLDWAALLQPLSVVESPSRFLDFLVLGNDWKGMVEVIAEEEAMESRSPREFQLLSNYQSFPKNKTKSYIIVLPQKMH